MKVAVTYENGEVFQHFLRETFPKAMKQPAIIMIMKDIAVMIAVMGDAITDTRAS